MLKQVVFNKVKIIFNIKRDYIRNITVYLHPALAFQIVCVIKVLFRPNGKQFFYFKSSIYLIAV